MTRCTNTVSTSPETHNGSHTVVYFTVSSTYFVVFRNPFFVWTGSPDTTTTGVGAEEVRFCRHDFRASFFRLNVHCSPEVSLANTHVEEIFPCFRLKVFLFSRSKSFECGLKCSLGIHVNWTTTFTHFTEHHVVTQTGRNDVTFSVAAIFVWLQHCAVSYAVVFATEVSSFSFKEKEPCTNRTVTIFKTSWYEAVFHHGHFCANLSTHGVSGTCVPYWVPCTTHTFTGRTWLVNVNSTTTCYNHSIGTVNVYFVITKVKANSTSDAVFFVSVEKKLNDKDTFLNALFAECVFSSFSNDTFVCFTVNHHLPATGANWCVTVTERLASSFSSSTVEVLFVLVFDPAREAPLFKEVNRVINVTTKVEDKVFTYETHEVSTNHTNVVICSVITKVGVNSRKTLCNSTGTFECSFINEQNFQLWCVFFSPTYGFKCCTTVTHTTANHEDINIMFYNCRFSNCYASWLFLCGNHRHDNISLGINSVKIKLQRPF